MKSFISGVLLISTKASVSKLKFDLENTGVAYCGRDKKWMIDDFDVKDVKKEGSNLYKFYFKCEANILGGEEITDDIKSDMISVLSEKNSICSDYDNDIVSASIS